MHVEKPLVVALSCASVDRTTLNASTVESGIESCRAQRLHPAQPCKETRPLNGSVQTPLPPTGIDGSYSQSCLLCLHGTDTGLAFGPAEAEWALA
ncbi:hypothetical protein ABT266_37595 [Amycolatopsis sp. NPDC000746]|uniref:hypothetical protein n=1 Tax=Amycolatopsis sp. NPDC000746 TaxID=3154270 RepID=UPI0033338876